MLSMLMIWVQRIGHQVSAATRIIMHPSAVRVNQGIMPFAGFSHWSQIRLFTARHLEISRKVSIVIHIDLLSLRRCYTMNGYLWLKLRVHASGAHHIVSNKVR